MEYRKLGKSDLYVSSVAMGCWAIAGDQTWGPQDEQEAVAAIRAALDAGINFFDTAEAYGAQGDSETLLGKALGTQRRRAIIASKASQNHLAPGALEEACEASLKRLQTDCIDLYQIHWPSRSVPLSDTLGALDQLRRQGKIRAVGISNFGRLDLDELGERHTVVSNQLPYSLLWRAIEIDLQPRCAELQLGILCYSPLAQGLLTGKFATPASVPDGRARTKHFSSSRTGTRHGQPGQEERTFRALAEIGRLASQSGHEMATLALAWLLHQPAVASVLAGARTPEQARRNAQAGDLKLSAALLHDLDQATRELRDAFGPEPDMWAVPSRYR